MHNFILKERPLSYNSCRGSKKVNYKNALEESYRKYNGDPTLSTEEIYVVLYYFFKINLDLDTDNLSKPVWDCLSGFLFNDDRQIKLRVAGSFDLMKGDHAEIDFSKLDETMVSELIEAFDNEEHIVYIECGVFNPWMYQFNLE